MNTFLLISIVVIIFSLIFIIWQRKNEDDLDLRDIDRVLDTADVYIGFGEKNHAITLLEKALKINLDHPRLINKLNEIAKL